GRHDQPVQRDRHGPADRSRHQELDPTRGIRQPAQGKGTRHRRRGARVGPHPAAADSHDLGVHDHGRDPGDDRSRRRLHLAPAAPLPMVPPGEALRRATWLDPDYVAAIGQVTNAAWARRSAFSVFILPSITLNTDAARSNPLSFNFVTFQPARTQVISQVTAKYDLFLGGQKFAELSRSGAALEAAHAGELAARFTAAQVTESTYYAVLADAELLRVARERVQRAEQQLAVARARVVSGAAVQTDSLQLRLELTRARVGRLVQETALRVARLELGRRVGAPGAVDAAPLDTAPAPELPLNLPEAVTQAASAGPQYRVARANERAAGAAFRAKLGQYLP